MSLRRARVVNAPIEDVWRVIEDAYQMPRWWPLVERVEGVDGDRFTQVFVSTRRRTVRADFRLVASAPPGAEGPSGQRTWAQELKGTPFERVLQESITEVTVEPAAEGATRVTIAQRHKLKGSSRLGVLSMRRATGKRLDQALDGLVRILG
ncbi:MAG TPA: SRPBCC family protein [Solirubrobacteraceae bacterium]|nr:SRPBCC family protein [Solirubrobacteraceae bacterium]